MMHDAIARDVMAGLLGRELEDVAMVEDSRQRLTENLATFEALLAENHKANLPEAPKAAIRSTQTALESYGDTANTLLSRSETGSPDELRLSIMKFNEKYDALAAEMERAADAIEGYGTSATSRAMDQSSSAIRHKMIVALIGILGVGAGFFALTKALVTPLVAMTRSMSAYARADFAAQPPGLGRKDEIGGMARCLEVFRSNGLEAERLRLQVEDDRERADLERRTALRTVAERLERDTHEAVGRITGFAEHMTAEAGAMTVATSTVNSGTASVVGGSEQALKSAEAVASGAAELSASIREISGQVAKVCNGAHDWTPFANRSSHLQVGSARRPGAA
ncbi:MAG: hypothetical protein RLY86_3499 [Pseudomonadota bacterium]